MSRQPDQRSAMIVNQLMTVAQAAEYLGVSESTVRKHVRQREIPHYRIGIERGAIRFDPDDLDAFLHRRQM